MYARSVVTSIHLVTPEVPAEAVQEDLEALAEVVQEVQGDPEVLAEVVRAAPEAHIILFKSLKSL